MWWTRLLKKLRKNTNSTKIQRQFLLILAFIVFAIIGYSFWKQLFSETALFLSLAISIVSVVLIYFLPLLLKPVLFVWLLLGMLLGELTSFLLLGVIYYLLFFPITFILRRSSKGDKYDTPKWRSRKDDLLDYRKLY